MSSGGKGVGGEGKEMLPFAPPWLARRKGSFIYSVKLRGNFLPRSSTAWRSMGEVILQKDESDCSAFYRKMHSVFKGTLCLRVKTGLWTHSSHPIWCVNEGLWSQGWITFELCFVYALYFEEPLQKYFFICEGFFFSPIYHCSEPFSNESTDNSMCRETQRERE